MMQLFDWGHGPPPINLATYDQSWKCGCNAQPLSRPCRGAQPHDLSLPLDPYLVQVPNFNNKKPN